jgi:hypothetical protein
LGIVPESLTRNSLHPLLWFSVYHHSLHSLAFALVITGVSVMLAQQRWKTGLLAFVSFHLHLVEDLAGPRAPDGYLADSLSKAILFSMEFALARTVGRLNSWLNIASTAALLLATFYLAWWRGFSPLEMISEKAVATFVAALRQRFPRHEQV